MTAAGRVQLWNQVAGAHPVEGVFTVKAGEPGVIEVELLVPKEGKGTVAWRGNGAIIAAEQAMSVRNLGASIVRTGNINAAPIGMYVNEIAFNDSTGDTDNSWVGTEPDSLPSSHCLWGADMDGDVALVEGEAKPRGDAPYDATTWNRFEEHAEDNVGIVYYSDPWPLVWDGYGVGASNAVRARGAVPLKTIGGPEGVLADVLAGNQDAAITAWAEGARDYGHLVYLRPWHEMNGTWYPWGRKAEYAEAWRHLHGLIHPIAPKVKFVWCVNVIWSNPTTFDPAAYYPGSEYVDFTGMDGYSGMNPHKEFGWNSATKLFLQTYQRLLEIDPSKPIMIGEVGCSEFGGSKAGWIADFLGNVLPYTMPQVKAVVWFNWNIEEGGGRLDWEIESSESARAAFAEGIASPYYFSPTVPQGMRRRIRTPRTAMGGRT